MTTIHDAGCPADQTCAPRVVDGTLQAGCVSPTPASLVDAIDAWFGRRRGAAAMASDRDHAEDLVAHLEQLGYVLVVVSRCRVCGCTDDDACWPSCWWSEPDLCSRCPSEQAVGGPPPGHDSRADAESTAGPHGYPSPTREVPNSDNYYDTLQAETTPELRWPAKMPILGRMRDQDAP